MFSYLSGGPPSTSVRRSRWRRDAAAATLSVLAHLAIFLAIFGSMSGNGIQGVTDPFGDGKAIDVMLAGREGAQSTAPATDTPQTDPLEQLAERMRQATPDRETPIEAPQPRSTLADLLQPPSEADAHGRKGSGRDEAGDAPKPGQQRLASLLGDGGADASAGDLWGQIEPCWTRIPARSRVPVTLEIAIDGKGRLATPPRIIRSANQRPDEQRLLAEAQALSAIQSCLPFKSVPGLARGQSQRVTFNRTR